MNPILYFRRLKLNHPFPVALINGGNISKDAWMHQYRLEKMRPKEPTQLWCSLLLT